MISGLEAADEVKFGKQVMNIESFNIDRSL